MDLKEATDLAAPDLMALQLADERVARLTKEAELELERNGMAARVRQAVDTKQEIVNRLSATYGLTSMDVLNLDTGSIARKS